MAVVYAFAAWTVFVWATRVRNIVEDQGSTFDLLTAATLAALGVAVAVAAWKGALTPVLAATAVVTLAVWAVRTPLILFDAHHGAPFKAVHIALAGISGGLALAAWRTTGFWPAARRGQRPASRAGTTSSG